MHFKLAVKGIIAREDGKILIVKRNEVDSFAPGIWETVGGGVDEKADPKVALEREIKEEVGLSVRVREPFNVFTFENDKREFKVGITYLCDRPIGEVKLGSEHSEFEWIDPKKIKQYETTPSLINEIVSYASRFDSSYGRFVVSQKAIIIRDEKCLIAEIHKRPGIWDLPGGRVDFGEEAEDSFRREMKEELGIDEFEILGICGQTTWTASSGVSVYGVASLVLTQQKIVLSCEHSQAKWITENELREYEFIWPKMIKMIKQAFEMKRKQKLLPN